MKRMKKFKHRVPRKLKKAARKLVREQTLPEFVAAEDLTKVEMVQYVRYWLRYGKIDKWTRKVIQRLYREERKVYQRRFEVMAREFASLDMNDNLAEYYQLL